ncbi:MAG: hypothetical protein K2J29_09690 [Muribaculaceae bacterium]|nr:hypothetical protein [Bacteroides sp.]MDE6804891.1 hypothetical protein [Muribaculaceae bacterium]MDE7190293.1 hypothetical protein [Muribaculaceae bacterium]
MSAKNNIDNRQILNDALKESFKKMLDLKKRLGQSIVTTDSQGNPIVISAEEAEKLIGDD